MKHIGEVIKHLRDEAGLTQADLARLTSKKVPEISAIETGDDRRTNMKLETIALFAKAFNRHPADLISMLDMNSFRNGSAA